MDAGLQMVTDLSMLGPEEACWYFFWCLKIRIKITLLSSNHVGRKFCICFKIDQDGKLTAQTLTRVGSAKSLYESHFSSEYVPRTVIEEAKYLIDYEASTLLRN